MYRYTTPTITCTFDGVDLETVALVRIAIGGKGDTIIREVTDLEEGTAVITLTQDETASLGTGTIAIQARIKYEDGTVVATNIVQTALRDVLDKVVM